MDGSEKVFLVIGLINLILFPLAGVYLSRAYLEKPWFRKRILGDLREAERRRELRQRIVRGIPAFTRLYRILWAVCIVYVFAAFAVSYYLFETGSPGVWVSVLIIIGSVLLIGLVGIKSMVLNGQYIVRRLDETESNWW